MLNIKANMLKVTSKDDIIISIAIILMSLLLILNNFSRTSWTQT